MLNKNDLIFCVGDDAHIVLTHIVPYEFLLFMFLSSIFFDVPRTGEYF